MTFEAYLQNIKAKTGKTPEDFYALAQEKGIAGPDMTASQLVDLLKSEYGLGHGHSMAIWAVFKDKGWASAPKR